MIIWNVPFSDLFRALISYAELLQFKIENTAVFPVFFAKRSH